MSAMPKLTVSESNHSMNCTPPYELDHVPLMALYSVVLSIGLPANVATVYMTYLQVRRKNVLGVYLLSLSLCDLTYLCTLPFWAIYINNGHKWHWSSLACKVTSYIFFNNMYISILLLCCVSVDRYVGVVYAVESRGLRQRKLAIGITATVCLLVALAHLPVFTMVEGEADKGQRRCFEPGQNTAVVTSFNYIRFVVGFFLPLCVLLVTNRAILLNVEASSGLQPHSKIKVKYLAVAVVALFLLCFAPYHIILLLRAITFHFPDFQANCHFERSVYTPYTISLGMSTFNSALNPILYVLASDNVRNEIRLGLCRLANWRSLQPRLTDSHLTKMHSSDAAASKEKNQTVT